MLKWSPEDGLQLDGFVDKEIPRCPGFDTSGKTIIEQSKDASTVWMKVRGVGRAIAPNVFPHTLMSLLHEGRLSFKPEKVIFFRETHFVSEKNSWTGSAVFSIADDLHFPDSLKRETFLNGRSIGWQSEGGLSYEEPGGFALTGTPLDKKAFSLNWSLPAIVWSKPDVLTSRTIKSYRLVESAI